MITAELSPVTSERLRDLDAHLRRIGQVAGNGLALDELKLGLVSRRISPREGRERIGRLEEVVAEWGMEYVPREGRIFVVTSADNIFELTRPAGTNYHERGYGLEPTYERFDPAESDYSFVARSIQLAPLGSVDSEAPYAYGANSSNVRCRIVDPKYTIASVSVREQPEFIVNPPIQRA
ncbi:MAG: hypothetical protein Q7R60_01870 [bacterium]|nr:hypothetical protein [bacterium]